MTTADNGRRSAARCARAAFFPTRWAQNAHAPSPPQSAPARSARPNPSSSSTSISKPGVLSLASLFSRFFVLGRSWTSWAWSSMEKSVSDPPLLGMRPTRERVSGLCRHVPANQVGLQRQIVAHDSQANRPRAVGNATGQGGIQPGVPRGTTTVRHQKSSGRTPRQRNPDTVTLSTAGTRRTRGPLEPASQHQSRTPTCVG